ncbi:hypothetical protein G5V58_17390 [Nocardioides anomalus]|uniref:Uncharacterized protein n=1 Tax=Nocardioides anomalus TaxID=2712223 RepID=A0A6G6WGF1_9ACTN|nr:hypothetical protein [Nocardioides anomalus]QIG44312.1 hypothetical protein G5V58_17390 [Nocardioides anomalus]
MTFDDLAAGLNEFFVERLREEVTAHPGESAQAMLTRLESAHQPAPPVSTDVCRRCRRSVLVNDEFVTHLSADGGTNRGCLAASFTPGAGWTTPSRAAGKRPSSQR